eukprot:m.50129 g.50129  ORF g.50129 m.50129 type:complete len:100 (-) comp11135_c0_seq1:178-477(-)
MSFRGGRGRGRGRGPKRVVLQPISAIFNFFKQQQPIAVWLFEQKHTRIEGTLRGFDEFMNLVLADAEEVNIKTDKRTPLGQILLKGDNITLLQAAPPRA